MRQARLSGGSRRLGIALVGVLAALALVSVLVVTIGAHMLANRRLAERRENQLQAEWLARAGVELAIGRLLSDPEGYTGETVEPIARSKVRVTVEREKDAFRVMSEARYPITRGHEVKRSVTRRVRRVKDGNRVKVEMVPGEKSASR